MDELSKIGLGGGCHWCTEAVFQSIKGVESVAQGFVAASGAYESFSEAVIVKFNMDCVNLNTLIEIHLQTHQSFVNHSMRKKYRSAIYTYSEGQKLKVESILKDIQSVFKEPIITKVLDFVDFKPSRDEFTNYYYKNPSKPFCEIYITPKLQMLMQTHSKNINFEKVAHLMNTSINKGS